MISREDNSNVIPFPFGSKAETLERLKPLLRCARVLDLYYFSVREWLGNRGCILEGISRRFGSGPVVVRSSATAEDGHLHSMAGRYTSKLDVDSSHPTSVQRAVEEVISAYNGEVEDQVLVQPMLGNVIMSGVLMTHHLADGSPYYVINYDDESGRTDTVTNGRGINKTVFLFRGLNQSYIRSRRVARLMDMAMELERICGEEPLDVEFGVTASDELYVFQVRRMSAHQHWRPEITREVADCLPHIERFIVERSQPRPRLAGRRTLLGIMPDWNPAELIGTTPGLLAISLFRELVTRHVWKDARVQMGYRKLPPEELMVAIQGHPYIDVRNSFNSFLPGDLDDGIAEALVDAWLDRLEEHPEFHDKVEFEVAQTAMDFEFDQALEDRYPGVLTHQQGQHFRQQMRQLTARALDLSQNGSLARAERAARDLAHRQRLRPIETVAGYGGAGALVQVNSLIEECKGLGTLPFSIIARHNFIAEALLRSAVSRNALAPERVEAFKRSVCTVTGKFGLDLRAVLTGETGQGSFLSEYGHLRPGTFDIRSPRYFDRDDILQDCILPQQIVESQEFALTAREEAALGALLKEVGLDGMDARGLMEYARRAVAGREYAKFVFTRNLSDALEWVAGWGKELGLGRDQLAHIKIDQILDSAIYPHLSDGAEYYRRLAKEGENLSRVGQAVKLGFLIRDVRDIYVVPLLRSIPNFISSRQVQGPVVHINGNTTSSVSLLNKVVCIENADPGFDWIFSKGIKGLVTKYGGANSHMSIRCAEFGLPAAIGCGEQTFERIVMAGAVELSPRERIVRPVYES